MDNIKNDALKLLDFIKSFNELKFKTKLDIKDLDKIYLNQVPAVNEYIKVGCEYMDGLPKEEYAIDERENVILSVRYAKASRAPEVPAILETWLDFDVNNFNARPIHHESIEDKEKDDIIFFDDLSMRVVAYDGYVKVWREWQFQEQQKEKVRDVYVKLRQLQSILEGTEATQELVVGNGIVSQAGNSVFYPLVTKSIQIVLDTKKNEVTILDVNGENKVETLAFQQLTNVENVDIKNVGLQSVHPMNSKTLFEIFQEVALKLAIHPIVGVRYDFEEKFPKKAILFTMQPVFFIRPRTRAVGRMVDEMKDQIQDGEVEINGFLKQALSDELVEKEDTAVEEYPLEETLARSSGESKDILFTKPANKEQLEIAERIEKNGVAVVQGPPGTGKTHTIANLIGNFLAEGKTVLVTSEKGKALSVLKNQVVEPLQSLCVYINGENKEEAIQSVQQIQEYKNQHNTAIIKKEIDRYAEERTAEIQEIARIRRLIYQIRHKQVESIAYDGKTYSPLDAAQFVTTNIGKLDYIPGKVETFNAFPLSKEDLEFLFATNETMSLDDEVHLADCYPEPEKLLAPDDFERLLQRRTELKDKLQKEQQKLGEQLSWEKYQKQIANQERKVVVEDADENAFLALEELLRQCSTEEQMAEWQERVILDGIKGEQYKEPWEELIKRITEAQSYYEAHCIPLSKKKIKIADGFYDIDGHMQILEEAINDKMDDQGNFGFFSSLFGSKYKEICAYLTIDGHEFHNKKEWQEALVWATFLDLARNAGSLWNQMMSNDSSVPSFETLSQNFANPLEPMAKKIPDIQEGLAYKQTYNTLMELVTQAGFMLKNTIHYGQWDDNDTSIRHEIRFFRTELPTYIELYKTWKLVDDIEETLYGYKKYLDTVSLKNKAWKKFASIFSSENVMEYRSRYSDLLKLIAEETVYLRRKKIVKELSRIAPGWSADIEQRKGVLGGAVVPDTIYDAWKWKQLEKSVDEINRETLDELEARLKEASKALLQTTIELCEAKAWYYVCQRIKTNPSLSKALTLWQLAIKKLGKGKSKNAVVYRQHVQDTMAEAQRAIPVWIMPFYMTYDFLTPQMNHFDVIIVDEASQSDLTAIATLQLADKVIVVGDDKQVSPTNMRITTEEIDKLRKLHLGKDFPKSVSRVMDINSSLYDFALLQTQSIMLTEHFRCVPEIIGYSNWLSYAGQIKALRPADSTSLKPAIISQFVGGERDGKNKINQKEAEYIVALLQACCHQASYKNQTFGVISLLGDQQAELINRLIAERIPIQAKEQHQIICGDAAQFQGDERDIIFLSMVDSSANGPLRFRAMDQLIYQQRYNVAVSRAKNQVWIIHSLHKNTDLQIQNGCYDIRRSLLEYAENPSAFIDNDEIRKQADSPFEVEVCQYLLQHGYEILQQYPVGAYHIDIVIKGKKVAIECDGDRWHSTGRQVANDMERQTILERLGWQFIRIRGTKYYRNKEETMQWVLTKLQELQVLPVGVQKVDVVDSLTETIRTEAAKILQKWKNGELVEDDIPEDMNNHSPVDRKAEEISSDNSAPMKPKNIESKPKVKKKVVHEENSLFDHSPKEISLFPEREKKADRTSYPITKPKVKKGDTTKKKQPVYQGTIEIGKKPASKAAPKMPPQKEKGPITRTITIGKKEEKSTEITEAFAQLKWKEKVDHIVKSHSSGISVKGIIEEIIEETPTLAKYKKEPFVKSAINSYLYANLDVKFVQCIGFGERKWKRK